MDTARNLIAIIENANHDPTTTLARIQLPRRSRSVRSAESPLLVASKNPEESLRSGSKLSPPHSVSLCGQKPTTVAVGFILGKLTR